MKFKDTLLSLTCIILCSHFVMLSENKPKKKAEKIGKKVTDFNDVDIEKLLDQWNVS